MAKLQTAAECRVRIENEDMAHTISSVRLEQYIDRHHELTVRIRLADGSRGEADFGDPNLFTSYLGKSISLNIAPSGGMVDAARTLEFIGVVTEVKFENTIHETNFVVLHAKSPTIALDGARRNSLRLETSAKDAIDSVLREHKITVGTLESTSGTMAFSVQYRETDFQYIMRLSSSNGLFAFYDGQKFQMQKAGSSNTEELQWRDTLGAFTMGLGTASQDFASQAWDIEAKESFGGELTGPPSGASPSQMARKSLGASEEIYAQSGFQPATKATDQASLDNTLARAKEAAVGSMVVCSGESVVPAVTIGCCVRINGMDDLDGLYWIRSIKHHFDDSGAYYNEFKSAPVEIAFPSKRAPRAPVTDLQTAVVVDNEDPQGRGRVKVKFPWSADVETPWLRVLTPHAGNQRGWYCIPEINDEVLVGFEHGNPDLPVVLGSLFNGEDLPPGDAVQSDNEAKMFMTKGGNLISFVDTDGSEEIKISQGDGENAITIGMSGPSITIESSGDISITGATISLESTEGDITVTSAGAVKQESTGDMQIKGGMNLKAEGSMNCELKGGMQAKLEGGAMTEVKGAMVKIN